MATSPLDFPAAAGCPVTQRATAVCAIKGHATHTVDGKDTGVCPRCGEVTISAAEAATPFLLAADGGHVSSHPSCEAAVAHARSLGVEAFEVYDADDRQVYAVRPEPRWV